MNILLNWKWRGPEMIDALEAAGHKVVYHVGITKKENFRGIFHDKRKAQRGVPVEGVGQYEFSPPTSDLIEKLYKTESIALTMMNRRESGATVDERRHIYYTHVGYWLWVLKTYKIDAIVFDDVPHAVNTLLTYSLAKILGIKTIMFQKIRVSDRYLAFTDWERGSEDLAAKIEEYAHKNFSKEDIMEDVRASTDIGGAGDTSDPRVPPKPLYEWVYSNPTKGLAKKIFQKSKTLLVMSVRGQLPVAIQQKIESQKRQKMIQTLVAEYQSLAVVPDWNTPFVYVPLHYQPERTTCPQGDIFVDQILAVETLSAALPAGWKIYVKEHPAQWHPSRIQSVPSVRYPNYYQNLARIPNVVLIPVNTEFFTPLLKSKAVATITGSAGLEAILHGKPVLIFGLPWYKDFPELFRVSSADTCRVALKKISEGFVISRQAVYNFFKAFEEVSFHGYVHQKTFIGTNSKLKEGESMNGHVKKILEVLAK